MNDDEDINILTFKQLRQLVSKYNTHFRSGLLTSKNWAGVVGGKGAKDRLIDVVKREYTWERTGKQVRFVLHLDPSTPVVFKNVKLTAEARKLTTQAPTRYTNTMRHEEDLRALSVVKLRQLVVKYNKEAKGTLTSSRKATAMDWGDRDKLIEVIKANYSWKKEIDEELTIRRGGREEEDYYIEDYELPLGVAGDKRADTGYNRRYWNIYKMTFTLHGDPDNPEVFRGLTGGQGQEHIKLGNTNYHEGAVERHKEWVYVPKKRLEGGGMRPYKKREYVDSKRAMGRGIKKVLDLTEEQMAVRMAEKHTQHTALEQRGLGYSLAEGSEIRERARVEAKVEAKRVYDLPENVEKRRLLVVGARRGVVAQMMGQHRFQNPVAGSPIKTKLRELNIKRIKKIKRKEFNRIYNLPENVEKRRLREEERDRRYKERVASSRAKALMMSKERARERAEAKVEAKRVYDLPENVEKRKLLLIAKNKIIREKNKIIREKREKKRRIKEKLRKYREIQRKEEEEWERKMREIEKRTLARHKKKQREKREKYGLE